MDVLAAANRYGIHAKIKMPHIIKNNIYGIRADSWMLDAVAKMIFLLEKFKVLKYTEEKMWGSEGNWLTVN